MENRFDNNNLNIWLQTYKNIKDDLFIAKLDNGVNKKN